MRKHHVLLVCAVLLLAGCLMPISPNFRELPTTVPGTTLPFEVAMQDALSQYAGTEPALHLVTSLDDAQVVADLLRDPNSEEFLERVQRLAERQILLALFDVPSSAGDRAIRAQRVVLQGDALYVHAAICHYQVGPPVGIQDFQILQVTLPPEAPPAAELAPVLVAYNVMCM